MTHILSPSLTTHPSASIPNQNKALEKWKAKMSSNEQTTLLKRAESLAEEVKDFVKVLHKINS